MTPSNPLKPADVARACFALGLVIVMGGVALAAALVPVAAVVVLTVSALN